jgi:chemotaxis protein histidine kinase CheA
VHVLRNCIDHGLETPEERLALGKAVPAKVSLSTRLDGDRFIVEMSDDGRGIDWQAVAEKAHALGHPASTPGELTEALFLDGLSTRAEASEHSGRGVGLGAVRQACERLGGRVEVQSQPGAGTTFRFVWSSAVLLDEPAESRLAIRQHPTSLHAAVALGR